MRQGVPDPKQVLATEIPQCIEFSEAQLNYIKVNAIENNTLLSNLDCCIELLKEMQQSFKNKDENIELVIKILSEIRKDAEKPINYFMKKEVNPEDESK